MEFNNTIEALHSNADEIAQLISDLKKSDEFRRIDVDLILDKLRSMYDLMLEIQKLVKAGESSIAGKRIDQESKTEQLIEAKTIQKETKKEPITEESVVFEEIQPEVKHERDILEIEAEKSDEEKLRERKQAARAQIEQDLKKEKEIQKESGTKKVVVSDRFKAKPTLAEELGSKRKFDDLASQLKSQGTSGINPAFGLAEKFEIIRELFDGDKEKFEHTLQVTGMAGSFVEAYNYLKENFNWDMDNPHVQRLLEQIRRKLIVKRKDE